MSTPDKHGWRSMESAPRDGTRILLYPQYMPAHWEFGDETWLILTIPLDPETQQIADDWTKRARMWRCVYADQFGEEPTAWQPLPEAPEDS